MDGSPPTPARPADPLRGQLPKEKGEEENNVAKGQEERPGEGRGRSLLGLVKYPICIAAVVFVVLALRRNLAGFDWRDFHPHAGFALAAAVSVAGVTVTQIIAYRLLLAAYGSTLTWPQAATLSWVPGLAKYIPGKVVAIGGTVYLLGLYAVPVAAALSVTLMGDAVAVLTGLIIGAPMLITPQARAHLPGGWVWCVLLILVALIALYPPIFTRLVNFALRKLKRDPLNATPHLRYYALPVIAGFAQWICWGIALWFTARSVGAVSLDVLPRFIVIAAMANTIAYLVIFAPGGIGFRELFLFLGLDPIIGHANAAIVVVAIRLIQTVVEILLAGTGAVILRTIAKETRP